MMKIAVDAMGGDNAPQAVIEGCIAALGEMDADIILVGKEDAVRAELEKYKGMYDEERLEIVHADEVIEKEDRLWAVLFCSRSQEERRDDCRSVEV